MGREQKREIYEVNLFEPNIWHWVVESVFLTRFSVLGKVSVLMVVLFFFLVAPVFTNLSFFSHFQFSFPKFRS